ncbi:GlsB/YeaQ/YmgE family stress response membrane protein [Candidatus Solirubrobacter pratensis]|uniref:GlsB/YeaQ/YmgE family stress response membrane protein n=1 Tax=Candidatus Solirubrobacter pratensis TaxID=1298857 RepID=UPI000428CA5E|nr:GlsB/YeaQ/YmgE family stress response membrane protein [Candidatus Solirubrobacter pratensis]
MIGAIILGIVAGFAGRLIMPGNDRMGFFATVLLGLAGAVVGWLIFTDLLGIGDTEVFDLGGLLSSIIGVVIILGAFRMIRAQRHA